MSRRIIAFIISILMLVLSMPLDIIANEINQSENNKNDDAIKIVSNVFEVNLPEGKDNIYKHGDLFENEYEASIERDYMQEFEIGIHTDTPLGIVHFELESDGDEDLAYGVDVEKLYVDDKVDKIKIIVNAQDATRAEYKFKIKALNDYDNIIDNSIIKLNVKRPELNLEFREIEENKVTMSKTYEVKNNGNAISDFTINLEDKDSAYFVSNIQHYRLKSNDTLKFTVVPIFKDKDKIETNLIFSAGDLDKKERIEFIKNENAEEIELSKIASLNSPDVKELIRGFKDGAQQNNGSELKVIKNHVDQDNIDVEIKNNNISVKISTDLPNDYEYGATVVEENGHLVFRVITQIDKSILNGLQTNESTSKDSKEGRISTFAARSLEDTIDVCIDVTNYVLDAHDYKENISDFIDKAPEQKIYEFGNLVSKVVNTTADVKSKIGIIDETEATNIGIVANLASRAINISQIESENISDEEKDRRINKEIAFGVCELALDVASMVMPQYALAFKGIKLALRLFEMFLEKEHYEMQQCINRRIAELNFYMDPNRYGGVSSVHLSGNVQKKEGRGPVITENYKWKVNGKDQQTAVVGGKSDGRNFVKINMDDLKDGDNKIVQINDKYKGKHFQTIRNFDIIKVYENSDIKANINTKDSTLDEVLNSIKKDYNIYKPSANLSVDSSSLIIGYSEFEDAGIVGHECKINLNIYNDGMLDAVGNVKIIRENDNEEVYNEGVNINLQSKYDVYFSYTPKYKDEKLKLIVEPITPDQNIEDNEYLFNIKNMEDPKKPPTIKLLLDGDEFQGGYLDLEIIGAGDTPIKSYSGTINDSPINIYRVDESDYYNLHAYNLSYGENVVKIKAVDYFGNEKEEIFNLKKNNYVESATTILAPENKLKMQLDESLCLGRDLQILSNRYLSMFKYKLKDDNSDREGYARDIKIRIDNDGILENHDGIIKAVKTGQTKAYIDVKFSEGETTIPLDIEVVDSVDNVYVIDSKEGTNFKFNISRESLNDKIICATTFENKLYIRSIKGDINGTEILISESGCVYRVELKDKNIDLEKYKSELIEVEFLSEEKISRVEIFDKNAKAFVYVYGNKFKIAKGNYDFKVYLGNNFRYRSASTPKDGLIVLKDIVVESNKSINIDDISYGRLNIKTPKNLYVSNVDFSGRDIGHQNVRYKDEIKLMPGHYDYLNMNVYTDNNRNKYYGISNNNGFTIKNGETSYINISNTFMARYSFLNDEPLSTNSYYNFDANIVDEYDNKMEDGFFVIWKNMDDDSVEYMNVWNSYYDDRTIYHSKCPAKKGRYKVSLGVFGQEGNIGNSEYYNNDSKVKNHGYFYEPSPSYLNNDFENKQPKYEPKVEETKKEEKKEEPKVEATSEFTTLYFYLDKGYYETLIDGTAHQIPMDVAPTAINQRTMLPIRFVAEAIGATVEWHQDTKSATFTKDGITATITLGNPVITVSDGRTIQMDAEPIVISERIMVPLTNISQIFGMTNGDLKDGVDNDIEWDQENYRVIIKIKK